MTRTIDGCPVCGSTRGWTRDNRWWCDSCGRVVARPAQITVPSSITQHVADTAAAEWQRWERLTTNPNAKEVIGCLCAGFDMECNCATAAAELRAAQKRVQPMIDREREAENITAEIMDFRMQKKGMDQQETFNWLVERSNRLAEIEAAESAKESET